VGVWVRVWGLGFFLGFWVFFKVLGFRVWGSRFLRFWGFWDFGVLGF
jgi:hypothetical protein